MRRGLSNSKKIRSGHSGKLTGRVENHLSRSFVKPVKSSLLENFKRTIVKDLSGCYFSGKGDK